MRREKTENGTKMPMDAMNTVDMVGAPSGSKTGQAWSQESRFKITEDMCKEKAGTGTQGGVQLLNTVNGHTGQYQKTLEKAYEGCIYCAICFRLFSREGEKSLAVEAEKQPRPCARARWFPYTRSEISAFVEKEWENNPMREIVTNAMEKALVVGKKRERDPTVLVCEHCSGYVRKKMTMGTTVKKESELPMWLTIRYIQSGGITTSPCRKMLLHCLQSLLFRFPQNPILHFKRQGSMVGLDMKLLIILHFMNRPEWHGEDNDESTCLPMARWLAEGSQHLLVDANFARRLRKFLDEHRAAGAWWRQNANCNAACRHCLPFLKKEVQLELCRSIPQGSELPSYRGVMAHASPRSGVEVEKKMYRMEKAKVIKNGITTFCTLCRTVSVISYEYDCLLRKALGKEPESRADVYYTQCTEAAC